MTCIMNASCFAEGKEATIMAKLAAFERLNDAGVSALVGASAHAGAGVGAAIAIGAA